MDFFSIIFRRIQGFIKSLISKLSTSLGKLKKLPQMAAKKAKEILKGILDFLIKKPSALTDYVKTGNVYIAKRALFFILLLIAAIVLMIIWLLVPFLSKTVFGTRIVVNTPQFYTAEGKVFLYDEDENLLYSGEMSGGKISGEGKLFENGELIYEGDFEENEYNGEGTLYAENGTLLYEGGFKNSRYEGEGTLYFANGKPNKKGSFSDGELSGEASLYSEDGKLIYTGEFEADKYSGEGKLYDEDGDLLYVGAFEENDYSGKGRAYKDGKLLYEGDFVDGKYAGEGTLYGEDGKPVYVGAFSGNDFAGQGTLNTDDGKKIEGSFENGIANGKVTLYAADGSILFMGVVNDGGINYYSYISASKATVEADFAAKCTVREIDGAELYFYPDLGAGFLFNGSDMVDRIIVTGDAELYGAKSGKTEYKPPEGASLYNSYSFRPTGFEKKLFAYIGQEEIAGLPKLKCEKYLTRDGAFVKLYYNGDTVAYYETGAL